MVDILPLWIKIRWTWFIESWIRDLKIFSKTPLDSAFQHKQRNYQPENEPHRYHEVHFKAMGGNVIWNGYVSEAVRVNLNCLGFKSVRMILYHFELYGMTRSVYNHISIDPQNPPQMENSTSFILKLFPILLLFWKSISWKTSLQALLWHFSHLSIRSYSYTASANAI